MRQVVLDRGKKKKRVRRWNDVLILEGMMQRTGTELLLWHSPATYGRNKANKTINRHTNRKDIAMMFDR